MTPFADSVYFSVLIVPTALAIVLGLAGRLSWRWVLAISLAMLAVQYTVRPDAASRGGVRKIWVVLGYAVYEWSVAALFLRRRDRGSGPLAFRTALIAALLPLLLVKFLPLDAARSWLGFLGISYVTFRAVDVVIGIQDRLIPSLHPAHYAAFLFFFPTISAGPIDRFNRFVGDLRRRRTRTEFLEDLDGAAQRLFRGLLYKFIVAALIQEWWLDPAHGQAGALGVVSYMYAYSLYLFFDFAGYSAFALAFSRLLGIRTPENFQRPFLAPNIVEFWNRWHISLSTWFRDHVYMRFVMAAVRGRWFRSRLATSCLGFYASFGLMGLWHGTAARYLVYGAYHATLLAGYTLLRDYRKRHPDVRFWPGPVAARLVTAHLFCFGLLIFSGRLG